jgi:hypothetical protein
MLRGVTRAVRIVGEVDPAVAARLAGAGALDTLEEVLRSGAALVEIVVQDEYTHDVVTRSGDAFLVFDTT